MTISTPQRAKGKLAAAVRYLDPDDPRIADARRELAEAKISKFVAQVLATAPPLSREQADRIASIIRGPK